MGLYVDIGHMAGAVSMDVASDFWRVVAEKDLGLGTHKLN